MNNLKKMEKELFFEVQAQRKGAWKEKDFKKATEIRGKQRKNYEKLQLLKGIIKASEKGNNNDK